MLDYPV